MEWWILAFLSAFFASIYSLIIKKGLKKSEPFVLMTWIFIISGIFMLIASLIRGIPPLGSQFYFALAVSVILQVFSAVLYFKALKITDLSLAIPMLSFTPIFLILTSFLILGEFPSTYGILGIVVIVFGSWVLNSKKNEKSVFDPIKYIFKHKGSRYMLGVAILYSLTANYGKMLLLNSDYLFGIALLFLVTSFVFLVLSFFNPKNRITNIKKDSFWVVIFASIAAVVSTIFINIALIEKIVPYVISIKRLSIIFSVLYGDFLFREKNITRRLIGSVIMLVGVLMILLF